MASRNAIAGLVIATGALVLFIGGGARFAIGLTLKPIEAELAGGRSTIGLAVAVFQLVSATAMLGAGRLADRIDLRLVLGLGVLVAGAGMLAVAAIGAPWQLVLCYGLIFGVGNGVASVIPVGVLVTRHAPDRAGLANAIALAGLGLGQLIVMWGLAEVLDTIGWRAVYVWLGALHLAAVPLLLAAIGFVMRQSAASGHPGKAASGSPGDMAVLAALSARRFWLLLAVYALCGLQDFFVTTHVVALAQDRGMEAVRSGQLLALMGLMMLLGVLAAGWSSDRIGPVVATFLAFAVRVVVFAAVLLDSSVVTVAVFALAFGATFLVTAPLTVIFVREAFGTRNLGALTGLITMVHHIFGGLGGLLGAWLFDASGGYEAALFLMLITSLAGAALTLGLRRPQPAPGALSAGDAKADP